MNILTPELLAQLYAQESNDPFLTLVTLSHPSFASDILLVNNTADVVSRTNTYSAFPLKITLPVDDGEKTREASIEFDNVSLELIDELRSVTNTPRINVKLELVLASLPNDVQMSLEELKIGSISYNKKVISAKLVMDDFLNTELTSEKYGPSNFPGLF